MNICVIPAAGVGERIGLAIPKQFYEVNDKPLLIYTLEKIENNTNIDKIVIVTIAEKIDYVKELCKKFNITKVGDDITSGGATNGHSIYNGIMYAKDNFGDDCNIMVHDGDRCLVSDKIIDDNIRCLETYGSAVTVLPMVEAIYKARGEYSDEYVSRDELYRIQTPYTYKMKDLLDMYHDAEQAGLDYVNTAPCILMQLIGKQSYLVNGSEINFKITNPEDLDIFKALVK